MLNPSLKRPKIDKRSPPRHLLLLFSIKKQTTHLSSAGRSARAEESVWEGHYARVIQGLGDTELLQGEGIMCSENEKRTRGINVPYMLMGEKLKGMAEGLLNNFSLTEIHRIFFVQDKVRKCKDNRERIHEEYMSKPSYWAKL